MKIDDIVNDLIIECNEDYVGLWSLLWDIKQRYSIFSKEEQQAIIKQIISPLLQHNIIVAGNFKHDPNDRNFYVIDKSAEDIINFIIKEWNKLGKEPNIGDVIWFTSVHNI